MPKIQVPILEDSRLKSIHIETLQDVAKEVEKNFKKLFYESLSPQELEVQKYVDSQEFKGGAWYRPMHNMMVTLAMKVMVKSERLNPDLVLAAQIHDIGYSLIDIAPSVMGPDWASQDTRVEHMRIGSEITANFFKSEMQKKYAISDERVKNIIEVVANHDNRYIGKDLPSGQDHLNHCDADSSFVISALSWYKDMIAYSVNNNYKNKLDKLGLPLNPHTHLLRRVARFYKSDKDLPKIWNKSEVNISENPFRTESQERVFPPTTDTAKKIVDKFFLMREAEASSFASLRGENRQFFLQAMESDLRLLFNFLGN